MFPTVLLPRQSVETYSKVLYDQILFLQKNWPLEHSGKQAKATKPEKPAEEKLGETRDYEDMSGRYFDNFGMC
jgi:hypothetical protein